MFGTEGLPNLLCKHASTSSVWNFYHWVKEVPLSKTSQATRSKEKRPFSQANSLPTNFIYPATWNLSESPATCKQLSGLCQKTLPEPNLCLKFCRQPMRVLLYEGSQTNLATCNLFPEAMMSFICQPLLHCWSHFWTPEHLLHPGSRQMFVILFCLKKKKKLKTEQSYKNWKFHIGEISGPCLALTHSPGLFLHKMGFEIMFDDYLVRKKAGKTIKILILEGCHTGFFHDFGQKLELSSLLCVTNLGVLYK